MKREIKFRAWNKTEGLQKMYYGVSFIPYGEGWSGGNPGYKYYQIFHGSGGFFLSDFSVIEIMQYTGLKDKNNKDICEGDIVRRKRFPASEYYIGEVVYSEGGFTITPAITIITEYVAKSQDIEVIGNIYENPELLETKKAELSDRKVE